jgi:uncharacterized protein
MQNQQFLNLEVKFLEPSGSEASASTVAAEFEGYASTFGNKDSYADVVLRGAFLKSLSQKQPKLLWQHDYSEPIGVIKSAVEDGKGLKVHGIISKTSKGQDVATLLRDGAVDRMSIGYRPVQSDMGKDGVRSLKEIDLLEISLVTFPANAKAIVTAVKDLSGVTIRDIESALKKADFSNSLAKRGASVVWGLTGQPEAVQTATWDAGEGKKIKQKLDFLTSKFKEPQRGINGNHGFKRIN